MEVVFIQETKFSTFNDILAKYFWGSDDVDWTNSNSEGASGGMVILWKKDSFMVNYSFIGPDYVGINVSWGSCGVNLVCVYATCSVNSREAMWESVLERRLKGVNEEWCFGGDFNEITSNE